MIKKVFKEDVIISPFEQSEVKLESTNYHNSRDLVDLCTKMKWKVIKEKRNQFLLDQYQSRINQFHSKISFCFVLKRFENAFHFNNYSVESQQIMCYLIKCHE